MIILVTDWLSIEKPWGLMNKVIISMEKMKRNIFILLLIAILFCSACTDASSVQKERSVAKKVQSQVFDNYQILNVDLLDKDFLRWTGEELIEKGAYEYAEEIKEEFVPTINENITFPEELIVMMEKILYYSGHIDMGQKNVFYEKALDKLGSNMYLLELDEIYSLFPQIENYRHQVQEKKEAYDLVCKINGGPTNCERIFCFSPSEGENYYVFECSQGGSNGAFSIYVAEYIENEFIFINEFETQNQGQGSVICYRGEFYYVFIQYNYNLKVCDGIRIHKLLGTKYENILIRYIPEQFIWKCLYSGKIEDEDVVDIDAYINIIKEDMISNGYMDNGTQQWGMKVYYGDEEIVPDLVIDSSSLVLGSYKPIYKIDLANCNLPIFLWKTEYVPSNTRTSEYLKIKFFYYDEVKKTFCELKELNQDDWSYHINLVQLWFKEIGEKIFTFRLYHINDYNYMLNIVLIEENEVTQIRNYIVIPQRKFVLLEGEIFVAD